MKRLIACLTLRGLVITIAATFLHSMLNVRTVYGAECVNSPQEPGVWNCTGEVSSGFDFDLVRDPSAAPGRLNIMAGSRLSNTMQAWVVKGLDADALSLDEGGSLEIRNAWGSAVGVTAVGAGTGQISNRVESW